MKIIKKIDNSKRAAFHRGKYKDPGAKLYDEILDSIYAKNGKIPGDSKELNNSIRQKTYMHGVELLNEVYLITGGNIKNSPYGRTPFSQSGCKYPHHIIKGDNLVISIPMLKHVYETAWRHCELDKDSSMKRHLIRHLKELGLECVFHHGGLYWNDYKKGFYESTIEEDNAIMESNFNDIFTYIMQEEGINLFENTQLIESPNIIDSIPDDMLLEYFNEGWDDFLNETLSDNYFTEASTKNIPESKESFKKRWHYNSKNSTIKYEDREFKIDINTDVEEYKFKFKIFGKDEETSDKKSLCAAYRTSDGPVIVPNNDFWKYSDDHQDAIILHEMGHIICQMTPKPFPKSIKELIQRIKKAIQRLIARIRMTKYVKGIHDDGYKEIEADLWAAKRISPEIMKSLIKAGNDNEIINKKGEIIKKMKKVNSKERFKDLYNKNEKVKAAMSFDEFYERLIELEVKKTIEYYTKDPSKNKDTAQRIAALNDKKLFNSKYFKTESALSGDGTKLTSNIWEEIGQKSPEALYKWMYNNINYDKIIKGWKLKSPEEVYKLKKGNCHDQSLFSSLLLHSLNFICGQLFFVECVLSSDNRNGNAHTMTWYRIDTPNEDYKHSYYWFETAWENQLGIHGPYNDMDGMKHAIFKAYTEDNDLNSHNPKYNILAIGENSNYRIGMGYVKYIDSWKNLTEFQMKNKSFDITSDEKSINEYMDIIDDMVNGTYFTESAEYDPPLPFDQLPDHLKDDEVHVWRAKHGIELIHKEPTLEELERIWENWNLMSTEQKIISDNESIRLFGMNNKEHYEKLKSEYNNDISLKDVKTPEELLKWMDCIQYGWIDKSGKVQGTGNEDDEEDFYREYRLQSPAKLERTKVGVCWDQTEFERDWFKFQYVCNFAVIYIEIQDGKGCPTHTFLIYEDENGTHWFEHSWGIYKGIHTYKNFKECICDVIMKHQKFNNDESSPVKIRHLRDKARINITCEQFMRYADGQPEIDLNSITSDTEWEDIFKFSPLFKESYENPQEESDNEDDNIKEEMVPIFGIIKSYSHSDTRSDGTKKTDDELSSIKFDKIIHTLTRGDNYSHALVSFDISLKEMYSYEDEGFVVDNIMEKESWLSTKSIYICVMFIKKSDRDKMKSFVEELKEHPEKTKYAMGNLIKAYIATPTKADKRFVCSSFTGYIMQCINPKNLHRDFSRLRPDDITLLPRAFYVANVKDRLEFINKFDEIKERVKSIYSEYKNDIDDYNNHLPKIMLVDKMQKLKTIDKILDWIVNSLA